MKTRLLRSFVILTALAGASGCISDANDIPRTTDATLFASNYYSAPGSNLQSVCFISGTVPFTSWPPRSEALIVDLAFGRELRPVTAAPVIRDSLLSRVTVRYTRVNRERFTLVVGAPVNDTIEGALAGNGTPVRVLQWKCPAGLPFRTDPDLLQAGYVADSSGSGYLNLKQAGAP